MVKLPLYCKSAFISPANVKAAQLQLWENSCSLALGSLRCWGDMFQGMVQHWCLELFWQHQRRVQLGFSSQLETLKGTGPSLLLQSAGVKGRQRVSGSPGAVRVCR